MLNIFKHISKFSIKSAQIFLFVLAVASVAISLQSNVYADTVVGEDGSDSTEGQDEEPKFYDIEQFSDCVGGQCGLQDKVASIDSCANGKCGLLSGSKSGGGCASGKCGLGGSKGGGIFGSNGILGGSSGSGSDLLSGSGLLGGGSGGGINLTDILLIQALSKGREILDGGIDTPSIPNIDFSLPDKISQPDLFNDTPSIPNINPSLPDEVAQPDLLDLFDSDDDKDTGSHHDSSNHHNDSDTEHHQEDQDTIAADQNAENENYQPTQEVVFHPENDQSGPGFDSF